MDEGHSAQLRQGRWDAVQAAEERVQQAPGRFGRVHAQLLRDALEVASAYCRQGQSLSVAPQVALLLRCSNAKADRLLTEASTLAELPGGFAALEDGVLTVEQSAVATLELDRVPDLSTRLAVWRRLLDRLTSDLHSGAVLPPPRLRLLLRRWVLELAPQDAVEQREDAAADRRVEYRRRDDGLADIFLIGMSAGLAQAVLSRIREQSAPVSMFDDRTADQRRLDAAVDLLLGRVGGHRHGRGEQGGPGAGGPDAGGPGAACGCLPGTAVPCGAQLLIHVPLGAALGTTDEVAVLSGHGPLEPDVLQELLLAAPLLRAVRVDADGVPVSVSDRVHRPQRRDRQSVRASLLDLAAEPPPPPEPRHANDHSDHPNDHPSGDPGDHLGDRRDAADPAASGAHPPDTPGPYRPARRLRRLVEARAPLCEFPGCGWPAVVCDAEHDEAWPAGPTCACQLGPCCRRHHRVKQEGWSKTRGLGSAVSWTSPSGRSWTSLPQHPAPAPAAPLRPLGAVPTTSPWDELDPVTLERELWELAGRPDDPAGLELRAPDIDPDIQDCPDLLGERLRTTATTWTVDLDDPYGWTDIPPRSD
jgi:hypothetical protein